MDVFKEMLKRMLDWIGPVGLASAVLIVVGVWLYFDLFRGPALDGKETAGLVLAALVVVILVRLVGTLAGRRRGGRDER